jgi:hypothetical protein
MAIFALYAGAVRFVVTYQIRDAIGTQGGIYANTKIDQNDKTDKNGQNRPKCPFCHKI